MLELTELPPARAADLRFAVDEACAGFLYDGSRREPKSFGMSAEPKAMELSYDHYPAELHSTVRAAAGVGWPQVGELSCALLSALSAVVRVHARDGLGQLTLIEQLPSRAG